MIVNLGQRPADRRGDRVLPIPNGELPAETPYASDIIAGLITDQYESPMQYDRVTAIRLADAQIRPDQRFYDREIEVAAQILAARSPTTETAQNWYFLIKQNMSNRIVSVAFCSYGEETDPVTRRCVTKAPQTWQPEPEPEPKPLLSEKTSSLILPLGIVGIIALVMLGGAK